MSCVRRLGFEETPNYDFLRALFTKILDDRGEVDDLQYDWMALNGGRGWEAGNTPSALLAQAHAHAQNTPHRSRRHRTDRERERDRAARREREREKERERQATNDTTTGTTPNGSGSLALPTPVAKKVARHDRLGNTPASAASVSPIAPASRRPSGLGNGTDTPRSGINATIALERANLASTHPYASATPSATGINAEGRPLSIVQNNNKPLPTPYPTDGTATRVSSSERNDVKTYRPVEGMRIENGDGVRSAEGGRDGNPKDSHPQKKMVLAFCCR
jgi:casein kinase 1